MKINNLKINSFGKLKNKEIIFNDNINIIYGKNESGKSTLIKFITNIFYGTSKNKKGSDFSDLEKYTPWSGEDFSGKLEYQLDNSEKYKIYREFKKKNPKIFNENMEDITKKFNIDKNKGSEFFYEQTTVDEELFLSTLIVNQQEVELEKAKQNILIQKLANLVGTGDDNVSFKIAMDRLNRKQLDEVGTSRSANKPINIISKKINQLEEEKETLKKFKKTKNEIEENKNKLNKEIDELENKNNILKELNKLEENEIIEKEKIKIQENMQEENRNKIKINKNKIKEIKNKKVTKEIKKQKKLNNKNMTIIFGILIFINILQLLFLGQNIINYLILLTVPTFLSFWVILYKKQKNFKKENNFIDKEKEQEINKLENEINLLEENNKKLDEEKNKIKNNINLKNNLEKNKINNNYLNKLEKNKLEKIINCKNIKFELENSQNDLNNKKIKIHSLIIDEKNINPRLENLSKIEEDLVNYKNQLVELQEKDFSINLAKEVLNKSYEKMKNSVSPKFTRNLSQIISKITENKYTNVNFSDGEGLMVEVENGSYEPIGKLSVGTIEQLYLALRLSMAKELSEENMPIILDEAFAYFDEERLKNILKYLAQEFKENQIIIFTCTNREKDILDEEKIIYNYIVL